MGITASFKDDTQEQFESLQSKILNAFIMAGEQFIKDAREQGSSHESGQYEDVTANLRNSVGYYIIHNGEVVIGSKPGTYQGKTNEGKISSEEINSMNEQSIQESIKTEGFQLIGIAGMNYASYVEAKGYNVISYQADTCMVNLAQYLEKLDLIDQGTAAGIEDSFLPDDLPESFYVRD